MTVQTSIATQIDVIRKSNIPTTQKAALIAQLEALAKTPAVTVQTTQTLVCEDCGKTTPRNSRNQKRCPGCREAREQASNFRAVRGQWREAKAAADVKHGKGHGIPEWGVTVGMTMAQALDLGLIVVDAEGNLGPAVKAEPKKAKKAKKAKAPKAPKVTEVEPVAAVVDPKVAALVAAGFTEERATALVAGL